jgi:hypothetical protein
MIRFIDNTSIHDVDACLNGTANNINQIKTFLRFIGEIIVSDRIFFTADKNSSVYPITDKAVNQIKKISDGLDLIEYYKLDLQTYSEACDVAELTLSQEIEYMTPGIQKTKIGDFIPKFSNGKNPLDMLHQNLINNDLYGNKLIQFNRHYSDPISSNIAPFVIFRDTIYSKIKRIIQKGVWNNDLTQAIVIAARMLVYEQIADKIKATYLPSTGRIISHVVNFKSREISFLKLTNNIEKDIYRPQEFGGLSDVVDSLIVISNGEPKKLLKEASSLRKDTSELRKEFSTIKTKFQSDAYLINSQRILKEYQDILEYLLKGKEHPSFIMSFKPQIVLLGIPAVNIDVNCLKMWVNFKRKFGKVKKIANIFFKADERRKNDVYKRLVVRCMGKKSY